MGRNGRVLGLLLALAGVLALGAGPASAATWNVTQLPGEAERTMTFGVSCPTTSLCVAGGSLNSIATSTDPTGGSGAWNVFSVGAGSTPLPENGFSPGYQIHGVDCPSPSFCVAVSLQGLIYTSTDPTGGPGAWTATDFDGPGPNTHFYGVSCPSPNFCVAAGSKGRIASSTDPAGGREAWQLTELGEAMNFRSVSCASPALCVAVGEEGWIASSTAPLGGATAWSSVQLPGAIDRGLFGVSCPVAALCVAGDTIGELAIATGPTGPAGAWGFTQGGGSVQITAVDCLSATQCVAVDNNADVLTSTDPTGGPGAWSFVNVLPYPLVDEHDASMANGMFGVSCPATTLCVVVGTRGQILTSTDPFAAPARPASGPKKAAGKNLKRVKRPRTTIASQPLLGVEIAGRRTKVRYRFYAAGHSFARGYLCRLDRRPARPCRSPKSYRVGLGRHVFRVRAIGYTGLRGPVATHRFEVCHPTQRGLCLGAD